MGKLKVIVLSGFLGSGKTTFIKNVIEESESLRISIIMNDISQFDMDVDLLQKKSIQFKKTKDMIEMGGGCVCCTLKDEMIKEVKKIHKTKRYDYLFIEATGISTPLPVAQAFHAEESIMKICQIYAMITVIDAQHFFLNLESDQIVEDQEKVSQKTRRVLRPRKRKNQDAQEGQKPTVAELMIDQLQVANLIILNKTDLISKKNLNKVIANLKAINPDTEIIPTTYSKVDMKNVISIKRFDLEKAEKDVKWIMEKEKIQDIPQTIKYNISSFVYERRRPFHPEKFFKLITDEEYLKFWAQITRAKGFFWLACHPKFAFTIQKAGSRLHYGLDQPWWCEISRQFWGDNQEERKQAKQFISRFWDEKTADKRIQLVFISQDLNKQEITNVLDSCLISENQLDDYEEIYSRQPNPFKTQFKENEQFFHQQAILVENDGDWEQVDEDEQDEEQSEMIEEKTQSKKTRNKK